MNDSLHDMSKFVEGKKLKDETVFMEDLQKFSSGAIKLNVGGRIFTTSKYTLSRNSDSMLATMVSGTYPLYLQQDGTIFIDRDGTHFRYVLNYWRGDRGVDSLPDKWIDLSQLLKEAKYYRIEGLVKVVNIKMGK